MKTKYIIHVGRTGSILWIDYHYIPWHLKAIRDHRYLAPFKTKKLV